MPLVVDGAERPVRVSLRWTGPDPLAVDRLDLSPLPAPAAAGDAPIESLP